MDIQIYGFIIYAILSPGGIDIIMTDTKIPTINQLYKELAYPNIIESVCNVSRQKAVEVMQDWGHRWIQLEKQNQIEVWVPDQF